MKINAICAFWVMFILSGALAAQNLKPKDNPKFLQSATYRIDQLIAEFYRSKKWAFASFLFLLFVFWFISSWAATQDAQSDRSPHFG